MKRLISSLLLILVILVAKSAGSPKLMWVDLSANWETFSSLDSINYYVDKCKDAGFNTLVVDVKGTGSAVAFFSDIAPRMKEWKGVKRADNYDFLKYFVDAAHRHGMKVFASFNVFCEWHGIFKKGILYDEKPQWQSINYVPGQGLIPITEIKGRTTAFTNPALPEVQEYERSIIVECAKKYDIDGVVLDRTRYDGLQSDFSDNSRKMFEKYIGTKLDRFPEDIYE